MALIANLNVRVGQQTGVAGVNAALKSSGGDGQAAALDRLRVIAGNLTRTDGTTRSGYLHLINSHHGEQHLQLENHSGLWMAFHSNRNREAAAAVRTSLEEAGVNDKALLDYLKGKEQTGQKIAIRTLQGHLARALNAHTQAPAAASAFGNMNPQQVVQQRPSVEQQRPSVEQQRPSVDQQRPSVDQQRPSVDQQRPSVDQEHPSAHQQHPSAALGHAPQGHLEELISGNSFNPLGPGGPPPDPTVPSQQIDRQSLHSVRSQGIPNPEQDELNRDEGLPFNVEDGEVFIDRDRRDSEVSSRMSENRDDERALPPGGIRSEKDRRIDPQRESFGPPGAGPFDDLGPRPEGRRNSVPLPSMAGLGTDPEPISRQSVNLKRAVQPLQDPGIVEDAQPVQEANPLAEATRAFMEGLQDSNDVADRLASALGWEPEQVRAGVLERDLPADDVFGGFQKTRDALESAVFDNLGTPDQEARLKQATAAAYRLQQNLTTRAQDVQQRLDDLRAFAEPYEGQIDPEAQHVFDALMQDLSTIQEELQTLADALNIRDDVNGVSSRQNEWLAEVNADAQNVVGQHLSASEAVSSGALQSENVRLQQSLKAAAQGDPQALKQLQEWNAKVSDKQAELKGLRRNWSEAYNGQVKSFKRIRERYGDQFDKSWRDPANFKAAKKAFDEGAQRLNKRLDHAQQWLTKSARAVSQTLDGIALAQERAANRGSPQAQALLKQLQTSRSGASQAVEAWMQALNSAEQLQKAHANPKAMSQDAGVQAPSRQQWAALAAMLEEGSSFQGQSNTKFDEWRQELRAQHQALAASAQDGLAQAQRDWELRVADLQLQANQAAEVLQARRNTIAETEAELVQFKAATDLCNSLLDRLKISALTVADLERVTAAPEELVSALKEQLNAGTLGRDILESASDGVSAEIERVRAEMVALMEGSDATDNQDALVSLADLESASQQAHADWKEALQAKPAVAKTEVNGIGLEAGYQVIDQAQNRFEALRQAVHASALKLANQQ